VEAQMAERAELVEAALEAYPEGIGLLDPEERVVLWNRAAERMTGFAGAQLIGRTLPAGLRALTEAPFWESRTVPEIGSGAVIHVQNLNGRDEPLRARRVVLRDPMGGRIGTAAVFHPGEKTAALPHGETCDGSEVQQSQAEMRNRLERRFNAFRAEGQPLSILWIRVDQAAGMRKTHGPRACEAMLECVERTLVNARQAGYEIGRWGDDEFLVMSGEPDERMVANRGQLLAGIARTADFCWWGDRLTLTVSIGAAAAETGDNLACMLDRAQHAMWWSEQAGGNQVTRGSTVAEARSHA
jgi:diguanylate cyclase (GGDEF)-like protein/PAS domain S-box-containing protein